MVVCSDHDFFFSFFSFFGSEICEFLFLFLFYFLTIYEDLG